MVLHGRIRRRCYCPSHGRWRPLQWTSGQRRQMPRPSWTASWMQKRSRVSPAGGDGGVSSSQCACCVLMCITGSGNDSSNDDEYFVNLVFVNCSERRRRRRRKFKLAGEPGRPLLTRHKAIWDALVMGPWPNRRWFLHRVIKASSLTKLSTCSRRRNCPQK